MSKSNSVWVLTDGVTGEYDVYSSLVGAAYGAIELLYERNDGKPIPKQQIEDFCDGETEEELLQHIIEHPDQVCFLDMGLRQCIMRG